MAIPGVRRQSREYDGNPVSTMKIPGVHNPPFPPCISSSTLLRLNLKLILTEVIQKIPKKYDILQWIVVVA
jgi:hypothetical protein